MPAALSAEMWTKMSLPPSSTATKPNPLVSLNHLTLPSRGVAVDGSGRRAARGAGSVERAARALDRGRGVDRDDAGHLRALDAHGDDDAHLRARQHGVVSGRVQNRRVQESVALPVGELDEAEPFVVLVPFHGRVDRRLTRRRDREVARRRFVAEAVGAPDRTHRALPRRVRHRSVVVEPVLARRPEVLSPCSWRSNSSTGADNREKVAVTTILHPAARRRNLGAARKRRNRRIRPRPDADRRDVRRLVEGRGYARRRGGLAIGRRGGNAICAVGAEPDRTKAQRRR